MTIANEAGSSSRNELACFSELVSAVQRVVSRSLDTGLSAKEAKQPFAMIKRGVGFFAVASLEPQ